LPSGQCQGGNRRLPPLGEYHTRRHARGSGKGGQHPDRIEARVGTQHQQADAAEAGESGTDPDRGESFAEEPRGQARDQQWLDRSERGSDTARQPVRGDEQQGEESADVQCAQDGGAPPPRPVRAMAADSGEDKSSG
jgi:hypothetical protein